MAIDENQLKNYDLFICNACGHVGKVINLFIDQETGHKICPQCYKWGNIRIGNGLELYKQAKQYISKFINDKMYREFINKSDDDRYLAFKRIRRETKPTDLLIFKHLDNALKIIEYCRREF